ncbi:LOW QUALITY PROTEIN: hypothetical protein SETIT_5G086400v2 [Setaria italica]|uniref:Uncharacterized protein n=1 Tax=Setaria italica TaxID=4555 RepID=A0A368R2S1_SETIT|nr:LOW QUALITY PROTEIN: hypothetical protein SETIT_5G086400v2 [Setaria italica]
MPTSTRSHRFAVVDAFTDVAFRGNPAAVCLLDGAGSGARIHDVDRKWMLAVAAESSTRRTRRSSPPPPPTEARRRRARFHIRWFTTVTEVELCGHATLAAAHFLLTGGVVGTGTTGAIEFVTMVGLVLVLTARWQVKARNRAQDSATHGVDRGGFCIELAFPVASVEECASGEVAGPERVPTQEVARLYPNFIEIQECAKRAIIIAGPAPIGSQVDFITLLFAPNVAINEDQVCGSVHCAFAPYWAKKLGKTRLTAQMASSRGGTLRLELNEHAQRVRIRGEAVTVMVGTLLA